MTITAWPESIGSWDETFDVGFDYTTDLPAIKVKISFKMGSVSISTRTVNLDTSAAPSGSGVATVTIANSRRPLAAGALYKLLVYTTPDTCGAFSCRVAIDRRDPVTVIGRSTTPAPIVASTQAPNPSFPAMCFTTADGTIVRPITSFPPNHYVNVVGSCGQNFTGKRRCHSRA